MDRWTTKARSFHSFLLVSQLDPDGIRRRIREARKAAGLRQEDLADLLEVHKRTVENYERTRTPDFAALNRIAAVLNRPVEWFLHGNVEEASIPELEAQVSRQGRLLEAIADALGLDVQEVLRDEQLHAQEHQPEESDPAPQREAARSG